MYTPLRASKPVIYSDVARPSGGRREDSCSATWWRAWTVKPRSTWRPCSRTLRCRGAVRTTRTITVNPDGDS